MPEFTRQESKTTNNLQPTPHMKPSPKRIQFILFASFVVAAAAGIVSNFLSGTLQHYIDGEFRNYFKQYHILILLSYFGC
ncbi:hypothetical protein SAMN05216327_12720 [Dyadobacter sp. SG02]|nr:hypothetical protein SAMN05216327_12720 [Dyadobacter sp. SG02]